MERLERLSLTNQGIAFPIFIWRCQEVSGGGAGQKEGTSMEDEAWIVGWEGRVCPVRRNPTIISLQPMESWLRDFVPTQLFHSN